MNIGICDDEKGVRDLLAGKVRNVYPDADILLYASVEELLV